MFVWELLLGLFIAYRGFVFSLRDRYGYVYIQPLISITFLSGMSYLVITRIFPGSSLDLIKLLCIGVTSLILGMLFRLPSHIKVDRKRKIYLIRGSYLLLLPTFALLGINYYLGYLHLTNAPFFTAATPERQTLFITFLTIMGTWFVMECCIFYKCMRAPSTPLNPHPTT